MDALDRGAVDADPGSAESVADQQLGEGTAEGVPHDDRRGLQLFDDGGQVVHHFTDADIGDRVRVGPQFLQPGLALADSRIPGRQYPETPLLIAGNPMLPGQRSHPQAVNQDNSVGCSSHRLVLPYDRAGIRAAPYVPARF
jgi:hypothetical protein